MRMGDGYFRRGKTPFLRRGMMIMIDDGFESSSTLLQALRWIASSWEGVYYEAFESLAF